MSILFMESFDHYTTEAQAYTKGWLFGVNPPTTSYKRTGIQSAGLNNAAFVLSTPVPNGQAIYIHHAVYAGSADSVKLGGTSGNPYDHNQTQVMVYATTDGQIYAQVHGVGSIGGTAPGVFRFGLWNYVQIKIVVSDTVGEVEVYLNGDLVLDLSAKDTKYDATTQTTAIILGSRNTHYYDDIVVTTNDGDGINDGYLGEPRVVCLLPQTDAVAAGSNADFTPSTGTDHGALVDEATPNDDTDYVSSSTLNHVDSWEFPALGYTGDIKGVQMSLRAKKSDSGTRAIAAVTKPAATNRVHATNHYLGMTDYVYWKAIWDQNPEDSAAWEVADVDGAEFGVKVTV